MTYNDLVLLLKQSGLIAQSPPNQACIYFTTDYSVINDREVLMQSTVDQLKELISTRLRVTVERAIERLNKPPYTSDG